MGRVSGKMALITGGAQGLGEAIGRMLAKEGAKVTLTDINGAGAEKVAASINRRLDQCCPRRRHGFRVPAGCDG